MGLHDDEEPPLIAVRGGLSICAVKSGKDVLFKVLGDHEHEEKIPVKRLEQLLQRTSPKQALVGLRVESKNFKLTVQELSEIIYS